MFGRDSYDSSLRATLLMMSYPIIQPPFTLVFREMSKKELKDYKEWFHKIMPERILILASVVRSTPGYEH